jgi:hypothetical protein
MAALLLAPFGLQGLAMFFDEFYFHRKRGLGLWERLGHPIDTLSVLACYLFVIKLPLTKINLIIFLILTIFSCLLVTKDEFEHKKFCDAKENWLHSVLFVLHPISFLSLGLIWAFKSNSISEWTSLLNGSYFSDLLWPSLYGQIFFVLSFMLYQIIYWSFLWTPSSIQKSIIR